ncbi:MAG: PaaI family thioesterase [Pseudomonadales bacterium]
MSARPSEERVRWIASDGFASLLGAELESARTDEVVIRLPYHSALGADRVHGGAISALVDIAATAAFWSHPDIGADARGATVGFTINFLRLARATDLRAIATVRRRGGTLCTGDVSVRNADDEEVAVAMVTYKLSDRS